MYLQWQRVNLITKDILDSFTLPDPKASFNTGGYYDNVYYLIGKSGEGFKLDLKGAPILTKTDINAQKLFFRGSDNTLYSNEGIIGKPTYTTGVALNRSAFTLKLENLMLEILTVKKFTTVSRLLVKILKEILHYLLMKFRRTYLV